MLNIACITLHRIFIASIDPTVHYNSKFGSGSGPIVWSYVNCQHWTKSVFDCTKAYYPYFDCSTNYIAGVTCTEGKQILIIIYNYCTHPH